MIIVLPRRNNNKFNEGFLIYLVNQIDISNWLESSVQNMEDFIRDIHSALTEEQNRVERHLRTDSVRPTVPLCAIAYQSPDREMDSLFVSQRLADGRD